MSSYVDRMGGKNMMTYRVAAQQKIFSVLRKECRGASGICVGTACVWRRTGRAQQ